MSPLGGRTKWTVFNGLSKSVTESNWSAPSGIQITVSEGHPFHSSKKKGVKGDFGGNFFTQKRYVESKHGARFLKGGYKVNASQDGWRSHEGLLISRPSSSATTTSMYPAPQSSSDSKLNAYGATAIANSSPTNSPANAAVFLGELLREGLPSLVGSKTWKSRTLSSKAAGDDYLNIQFGWRPLLEEITNFGGLVTRGDSVLSQFERDAGKDVRRRFEFPTEKSSNTYELDGALTPLGQIGTTIRWDKRSLTREVTVRRWFSGSFTYHLPSGYSNRKKMGELAGYADRLGLHLTPETLWNLAPWSWAVDWFSNTGDVFTNVSNYARYGLIVRYGYIMEHSIVKDTYSHSGTDFLTGQRHYADPLTLVTETKIRRKASPFGFGVNLDALDAFQLSILAALGISKSG